MWPGNEAGQSFQSGSILSTPEHAQGPDRRVLVVQNAQDIQTADNKHAPGRWVTVSESGL